MSSANHQILKDSQTITKTILSNVIKMLIYRKWIKNVEIDKLVEELIKTKKDEKIYNIKLSENLINIDTYEPFDNKKEWKNFNGNNVVLFMSNLKIAGKSPQINEFVSKYPFQHKIIIVDSITDKSRQTLTCGKFIEIFSEDEFMMNIMEHVCCPKFIVLKNNELDEILHTYNAKRKELPKQFDSDPISRYLFLRRGQAVRIIRNSEMTGNSVSYRIIIHKGSNVDK